MNNGHGPWLHCWQKLHKRSGGQSQPRNVQMVLEMCAAAQRSGNHAALREYHEFNNSLPACIIVYRHGVGDGQLHSLVNYGVEQIIDSIRSRLAWLPHCKPSSQHWKHFGNALQHAGDCGEAKNNLAGSLNTAILGGLEKNWVENRMAELWHRKMFFTQRQSPQGQELKKKCTQFLFVCFEHKLHFVGKKLNFWQTNDYNFNKRAKKHWIRLNHWISWSKPL